MLLLTHLNATADLTNVPRLPGSYKEQNSQVSDIYVQAIP